MGLETFTPEAVMDAAALTAVCTPAGVAGPVAGSDCVAGVRDRERRGSGDRARENGCGCALGDGACRGGCDGDE